MSSTLPSPGELLLDPRYPQLKEYLIQSTGLAYYADKDADFARRIHRRLSSFGARDCSSYLEALRDPRQGPSELDALIAEITIGESYFFRHREHFEALRDVVLPERMDRNAGSRRLNIWCAGCADGAEPYSLSILLRRELAHLLQGWEIAILGTDINRQNLATAREGRYEEWSLRSTSEAVRAACFQKDAKRWSLASEFKKGVSFQVHNLVDSLPAAAGDCAAFDLIVCRNVMIYFEAELMRRIVRQFHGCLAPGGWLLVGPSEPNMTYFTAFQVVNAPGVTLYQKALASAQDHTQAATPSLPPLPTLPPPAPIPKEPAAEAAIVEPTPTDSPVATLEDLRGHSDRGDWESSIRCCERLLETDNLNPLVHFHYALVLQQTGNHSDSERSFRKAIYLDRQAVLAHYHLGVLLRLRGELRPAMRSFENTLGLLDSRPGDQTLAGGDGITVADLKKMVRKQMETLGVQA